MLQNSDRKNDELIQLKRLSSSKSLHWLFCKDTTVPINRTRRASSIAMDPRMQKRKSVIKKTGLEELKKELEMDEHQIHLEELATRLGTDLNSVSACGSVYTGPFWQLCSLNWLQSWSCIWYGSAYNIKWYIPPTPLSLSTQIQKLINYQYSFLDLLCCLPPRVSLVLLLEFYSNRHRHAWSIFPGSHRYCC